MAFVVKDPGQSNLQYQRHNVLTAARIVKVDPKTQRADLMMLDTGIMKQGAELPSIGAGNGYGTFGGFKEGDNVRVLHTYGGMPIVLHAIPRVGLFDNDPNAAVNVLHTTVKTPTPGSFEANSSTGASASVGRSVTLKSSSGHSLKLDGKHKSLSVIAEMEYYDSASRSIRSGTTLRDINRVKSKDDATLINPKIGAEYDQALEPVGKMMFEDGSDTPKLALHRGVEFTSNLDETFNQKPVNQYQNEAFAEHRELYREFSEEYLEDQWDKIRSDNPNYVNVMDLRTNTLELGDNDLIEIIKGPLVDINGLLLDINYMPLNNNINSCPVSEINTVFINGVSVSGDHSDRLTKQFPTRINNATVFNFQVNTLGTDYKREMHYTSGADGKKQFHGLTPGKISKNWAYDTALDSSIWGNVNAADIKDCDTNEGAHIEPLFQFAIDKNGAFKLHIPTSSVEHSVMEWVKYDFDDVAESNVEKGESDNYDRTKQKNTKLFDRVMRYGGELYHPVHHTSLPTVGSKFRVLDETMASQGGNSHKHYAMISPVGTDPETGAATRQGNTDLFDNNTGKSHTPSYCPIGQSGKIGIDGRLDISVGRDHADWKSIVADLRGGAVLRLGRMYDEQPCECKADKPYGTANVQPRVGSTNEQKIYNDRRSLVFETDGVITGTIGRSIERELSLDLNTKAGVKMHVGKSNYGIKLERKLLQFSRGYDPSVDFDATSKENVGYKFYESSAGSNTWDEFKEERHDKIAFNPRFIDGTYNGSPPVVLNDTVGDNPRATPDSTNAVASRSLSGGVPKIHHSDGYNLTARVPVERVNRRTMHYTLEEIAHVVNNRHRKADLGGETSDARNSDARIPVKMDMRDSEAGSININAEADALVTLRDDLDYGLLRGNRTSLRLDTSGQIAAWLGADIDDYRSVSAELDGAVQAAIGKTKAEGKSIYATMKGGIKMLVGLDNQNVEHNTDEGLKGFPSAGSHNFKSSRGTGSGSGGNKYSEVGFHPFIHMATTYMAGAELYGCTDSFWAAHLNNDQEPNALQTVDIEGTSINVKTIGSSWFTLGMNNNKESLVLDTAGSVVSQVGVDKYNRSGILHCDGSMSVYLGKEKGGDSLHIQMAGGARIAIQHDQNNDAVTIGVLGNVVINIEGADNVETNVTTKTYRHYVKADSVQQVFDAPTTDITYTGACNVHADSFFIFGKQFGHIETK